MSSPQSDALTAIEKNLMILEKEPAALRNSYQRGLLRDIHRRIAVLATLLPIDEFNLSGR